MANDKKVAFPLMPTIHWWALRTKFQHSIPGVVTDSYVATVLNMKENSARANVLPYLKQVGIIDDEGKPKNRAKQWRDDSQYPSVCKEIIKEVYPQELIDACPDPISDKDSAERWFANYTGGGQVAVRKMVSFYSILSEADPSKAPELIKSKKVSKSPVKKKVAIKKKESAKDPKAKKEPPISGLKTEVTTSIPGININLQIHISADASPDQIDKIFESMAKHIYKRVLTNE